MGHKQDALRAGCVLSLGGGGVEVDGTMAVGDEVDGATVEVPAADDVVVVIAEVEAPSSRGLLRGRGFRSPKAGRLSMPSPVPM